MELNVAVADYLYMLRGKSPHTQRSAKTVLDQFIAWCDQQNITLEQLTAVRVRQYSDYLRNRRSYQDNTPLSSNTTHTHITRIKALLAWLHNEECYTLGLSERAVKRIELPRVDDKVLVTITRNQFDRLLAACENSHYYGETQRNRAILALLYGTGIRAAELCGLTIDQVDFECEPNFIRVFGKGRKQREIPFGPDTRKALRTYIRQYRKAARNEVHVFISHLGKPLTPWGLNSMLYGLTDKAGITGIHCHLFRHSFAVNFLKAGGDVYVLSRLLGHSSITMTERYLRAFKAQDARQSNILVY